MCVSEEKITEKMAEESDSKTDIVCWGRRIESTSFDNVSREKLASLLVKASGDNEDRMAGRGN